MSYQSHSTTAQQPTRARDFLRLGDFGSVGDLGLSLCSLASFRISTSGARQVNSTRGVTADLHDLFSCCSYLKPEDRSWLFLICLQSPPIILIALFDATSPWKRRRSLDPRVLAPQERPAS